MNWGAEQAATADPIFGGTFKKFSLADVFGVLALSRQLVGVRFSDEDKEVGAIAVKAGQVIEAEDLRTRTKGADALKGLVGDPGTAFAIVKLPLDTQETQATGVIGKLADLLPEADRGRRGVEKAPSAEPAPLGRFDSPSLGDIDASGTQAPALIGKPGESHPELDDGPESDSPQSSSPSAQSSHVDAVIMSGDISDVSFGELLEVLQLSQQHLLISFIRGGSPIGTLNLMSGRVLAAATGSLHGMEAFKQLYADHGEKFEVRRSGARDVTQALGGIPELLADMRQTPLPSPTTPRSRPQKARLLFMRGRLSDFPLVFLASSLALCRQPLELVLRREEKILHQVLVKSGHIIAAASVFGEGADAALAAIREDPGVEFLIYRRKGQVVGLPVASLTALVSETDAVPGLVEERLAPPVSPAGAPVASARREAEAGGGSLSGIEARIEQIATDMTALQAALGHPKRDPAQIELAQALLRLSREHARESATQEMRTVLATLRPSRRERALLWSVLALQAGTLAVAVGLLLVHAT